MASSYARYPSLEGKIVVITGGAEGIGAAAVRMFAHQGSKVAILDISKPSAMQVIEQVRSSVTTITTTTATTTTTTTTVVPTFYECDVTDLSRLKEVANAIIETFGRVDILVNNAAAAGANSRVGTFDVTEEMWDFQVQVNLRHQFFLSQYLARSMKASGGGSIINMGSITWRICSTCVLSVASCC